MPTHPDWPSLTASFCWPLSTPDSASPFANCLLWVPFSNYFSGVHLPTSGLVEDFELRPLFGFAPKQTKGSSTCWTTHIVSHQVLPLWARVDLEAMAMKEYSAFPKALALLKLFSVISRTLYVYNPSRLDEKEPKLV